MSGLGFGGANNDPLVQAMDQVIQAGLARTLELATTGFLTGSAYDLEFFRSAITNSQLVTVTSMGTNTQYGCMLLPDTLTEHSVRVVLVALGGAMMKRDSFRKLTFVNQAGALAVKPGWR